MENELKSNISIMERLAEVITNKLNSRLHKQGLELMKMKLGLEVLLINLSKFAIIFMVAAQFSLLKEAIFMSLVFGSVRRYAFGLHAKNSIVCTIVSLTIFVFGAYISYHIRLSNVEIVGIFLTGNILLYKYSPGDTENHPILGHKLRNSLKRYSLMTGILLMLITLVIPSEAVKAMIIIAVGAEVVSILPITYKILNRRYKNYEEYERATI